MKQTAIPISVKLPKGINENLDNLVKSLKITKSQFIRNAIIEKLEDALDIKFIEKIAARNEKTYSLDEVKRELGLED